MPAATANTPATTIPASLKAAVAAWTLPVSHCGDARVCSIDIPVLSEAIWDTQADMKKASKAKDSLEKATALVSNKDTERFIPALIKALINPVEEVHRTITLLSATTLVSEVK